MFAAIGIVFVFVMCIMVAIYCVGIIYLGVGFSGWQPEMWYVLIALVVDIGVFWLAFGDRVCIFFTG